MAEDRDLGAQAGDEQGSCARGEEGTFRNDTLSIPEVVSPDPTISVWERDPPPAVILRSAADPSPAVAAELVLPKSSRLFLQAYSKGGGMVAVGREWARLRKTRQYSTDDAAHAAASRKLAEVRRAISSSENPEFFWELMGLSADRIAATLRDGMQAVKTEAITVRTDRVVVLADGRERVVREEEIVLKEAGPDFRSRIEAAVRASQLRGELYASRRNPGESDEPHSRKIIVRWLCD